MSSYDNGDELIAEIKDRWNKNLRSMRIWGVIAAILMLVTGFLCIAYPVEATYEIEILAAVAMFCFGIWEIVQYAERPVFLRRGSSVASGILNILLAILLLTSPAEDMMVFFGFLFGLDLMMLGFDQVTIAGSLRAIGAEGTGWLTVDGILNIIFGILLLFMPVASVPTVSVIMAMYLIFGGISLLVMSISAKDLKA